MRRYAYGLFMLLIMLVIFALLSGCATIGEMTGFTLQKREGFGPQVLWHSLVLEMDVSTIERIGVAQIPPQLDPAKKLPWEWKREVRYEYEIDNNPKSASYGKEISSERWVFRAPLYRNERFIRMLEAVAFWGRKDKLYVIFPDGAWKMSGKNLNLVVLSPDGSLLLMTNGEVVDLPKGQSLMELPQGFFQKHPSPIPTIYIAQRGDAGDGDKFFAELEELFPRRYVEPVSGRLYSARPKTGEASKSTLRISPLDRVFSCGSFAINPLTLFNPITAGISLGIPAIRNVDVAINGCP